MINLTCVGLIRIWAFVSRGHGVSYIWFSSRDKNKILDVQFLFLRFLILTVILLIQKLFKFSDKLVHNKIILKKKT